MCNPDLRRILGEIAKAHLGIDTIASRDSDSLDFHEVSVWGLEAALMAAYNEGRNACEKDGDQDGRK